MILASGGGGQPLLSAATFGLFGMSDGNRQVIGVVMLILLENRGSGCALAGIGERPSNRVLSASSKQTKLVAAEDQSVVLPRDVARQGCQGAPHLLGGIA